MSEPASSSLRDILNVPFKHWGVIAVVLLLSLSVGLADILLVDPEYVATSKLLVEIGREKTAPLALEPQPSYNVSFQERPQNINNEIEILRDPALMAGLLPAIKERLNQADRLHPPCAPAFWDGAAAWADETFRPARVAWKAALERAGFSRKLTPDEELTVRLLGRLDIDFTKETDVINVSFRWNNPEIAAFVTNLYVQAYQERHIQIHGVGTSSDFYKEQLAAARRDLDDADRSLGEFMQNGKISNIEAEKSLALNYLTELDKESNQARISLDDVKKKLADIEQTYRQSGKWIETPESGESEAGIRALDQSFVSLSTERTRLLAHFSADYPAVASIDQQLSEIREQKHTALKAHYAALQSALVERAAALDAKIQAKKDDLAQLSNRTLEYEKLKQRQTQLQTQVADYRKKVEDLRISEDLDARNFTSTKIISTATAPIMPSAPKKSLILCLAALIGLLLGLAFAVIAEFFNHTFRHEQDVRRVLGVPLLLTVPLVAK